MSDSVTLLCGRAVRALIARLALCICIMTVFPAMAAIAQDDARTSAIKAAFIYNFAKFTSWPGGEKEGHPTDGGASDLRFCFYRGSLDWSAVEALAGKMVNDRRVQVVEFRENQPRCDVVYVGAVADAAAMRQVIERNSTRPTLLVSDIEGFTGQGGDIELYTRGGRLRFKVNLSTVSKRQLKLSSKVLQLAEIVGRVE